MSSEQQDRKSKKIDNLTPQQIKIHNDWLNSCMYSVFVNSNFYHELWRWIRKVPTSSIPTAGVMFDKRTMELVLLWNPEYVKSLWNISSGLFGSLIRHEIDHITLQHITSRKLTADPRLHTMANWAADCAINGWLIANGSKVSEEWITPSRPVVVRPELIEKTRKSIGEEKCAEWLASLQNVSDFVESLPVGLAQEDYWGRFRAWAKENPKAATDTMGRTNIVRRMKGKKQSNTGRGERGENGEPGESGEGADGSDSLDGMGDQYSQDGMSEEDMQLDEELGGIFGDVHDWEEESEDVQQRFEAELRDRLRKAANEGNKTSGGWGNMPQWMIDKIKSFITPRVDWEGLFRNFTGRLLRAKKTTSMKRLSRKAPMVHPGKKISYNPRILIAIDQSGSVDDESLGMAFAAMSKCSKTVTFDTVHFDTEVDEESIKTWKRGKMVDQMRTRCGGTDFDAVTKFLENPKYKGRWDGVIILTDGEAPAPRRAPILRGWLIVPNRKLIFSTHETVVTMEVKS